MKKIFLLVLLLSSKAMAAADAASEAGRGPVLDASSIFSWVMSTFLILFIILLMAYLLKKTRFVKVSKGGMSIENQIYVGPKQRVVMLKIGQKKILIGVSQNQISYLTEFFDVPEDPKDEFKKIMNTQKSDDNAPHTTELQKNDESKQ